MENMTFSFYSGFEKQKELTMMNTMQVRKEAQTIMKKLHGGLNGLVLIISFPEW